MASTQGSQVPPDSTVPGLSAPLLQPHGVFKVGGDLPPTLSTQAPSNLAHSASTDYSQPNSQGATQPAWVLSQPILPQPAASQQFMPHAVWPTQSQAASQGSQPAQLVQFGAPALGVASIVHQPAPPQAVLQPTQGAAGERSSQPDVAAAAEAIVQALRSRQPAARDSTPRVKRRRLRRKTPVVEARRSPSISASPTPRDLRPRSRAPRSARRGAAGRPRSPPTRPRSPPARLDPGYLRSISSAASRDSTAALSALGRDLHSANEDLVASLSGRTRGCEEVLALVSEYKKVSKENDAVLDDILSLVETALAAAAPSTGIPTVASGRALGDYGVATVGISAAGRRRRRIDGIGA